MSENPVRRKFSRHIDIRRYFVRELVKAAEGHDLSGDIAAAACRSQQQNRCQPTLSKRCGCRRKGRNKTGLGRECLTCMQEHVRRLPCGQGQGYARIG